MATHLARVHGMTASEYRERHNLPSAHRLAGSATRLLQRANTLHRIATGDLTFEHLPRAVEQSRRSVSRPKRGAALEKQREVNARVQPWKVNQLPPGARRARGEDADRAREYQRAYRARLAGDEEPMRAYREKFGR